MSHGNLELSRLGVLTALLEGDSGTAYHQVLSLLEDGVPFSTVLTDILAPIQHDVGDRWEAGEYLITEEHASTAAVETLVALLGGAFESTPDADHIVIACAEGDNHHLPPRMASAVLASEGRRVTFLGSALPAADLGLYLAQVTPATLLLACSMPTWLLGARDSARAAHAAGVPVLAGGRGFGGDASRATAIGADAWTSDITSVGDLLDSWDPDIEAAEQRARPPARDVETLMDGRTVTLVTAEERLREDHAVPSLTRLRLELNLLFDTLLSATYLDDPALLADFIGWQRQLLGGQGVVVGQVLPDALLEALEQGRQPTGILQAALER